MMEAWALACTGTSQHILFKAKWQRCSNVWDYQDLEQYGNHMCMLEGMFDVAPPRHDRDLIDWLTTCLKAVWRQEEALDCMLSLDQQSWWLCSNSWGCENQYKSGHWLPFNFLFLMVLAAFFRKFFFVDLKASEGFAATPAWVPFARRVTATAALIEFSAYKSSTSKVKASSGAVLELDAGRCPLWNMCPLQTENVECWSLHHLEPGRLRAWGLGHATCLHICVSHAQVCHSLTCTSNHSAIDACPSHFTFLFVTCSHLLTHPAWSERERSPGIATHGSEIGRWPSPLNTGRAVHTVEEGTSAGVSGLRTAQSWIQKSLTIYAPTALARLRESTGTYFTGGNGTVLGACRKNLLQVHACQSINSCEALRQQSCPDLYHCTVA